MQSLFPQQGGPAAQHQPILQFKAGKCNMVPRGNKFLVSPDLQKGMISLTRTNDNLINFQWSDRASNTVETGLILFPDDVDFKKVNTGQSNDRVYMLKWRNGGKVLMFWMQDKSTTKDIINCSKVNELINNPRAAVENGTANVNDSNAGMGPEAWMQLLGLGNAPAPSMRRPDAPASTAPPAQQSILGNLDLSSLLRGVPSASSVPSSAPLFNPATSSSALTSDQLARTLASMTAQQRPQHPALQDILAPEAVLSTGILEDTSVVEALANTLPEDHRSVADVTRTLRSPQLRQALSALSEGISGENYGAVLANFGINPAPGNDQLVHGNAVGAFVSAIQADVDATTTTTTTSTATSGSATETNAQRDETKDAMEED